jgi:chromosome segregation protein
MAFLKGLELHGFKSFAGKTVLDFPSRVVSIVGPNGSGKSNVIDALRWVLGEREAKQLRGATLENLIFAGTPKRAAVGVAKVGLIFDNSDRTFAIEANEVVLERRVDRSGVSQFFINGDELRLKDLIPMLARAKLGARGLTMIGQGQSDVFVQSSPDDRRMMIEEVLGLKEFRIKKAQAERRLDTSRTNMDKVQAMLEELLPHLRLLRRQKHRWDRRSEIETELRDSENKFFSYRYHELQKEFSLLQNPSESLVTKKGRVEKDIAALEEKIKETGAVAERADRSREVRDRITELFRKKTLLGAEIAKLEVKIEFEGKSAAQSNIDMTALYEVAGALKDEFDHALSWSDIEKIKGAIRAWSEKLSKFFAKKTNTEPIAFENEKKRKDAEAAAIDIEIKNLRDEEENIARTQDEANKEFRKLIEELEEKKNEIRKIDREVQEHSFARERIAIRKEELEKDWIGAGRIIDELRVLPRVEDGEVDMQGIERRIFRLRGELAAIGEIDENLVREANESEIRYEFLSKELADLEMAIADLRKLITDLEVRIGNDFKDAFRLINDEFNKYFRLMFGGGKARMKIERKKKIIKEGEDIPSEESAVAHDVTEEEDDTVGGVEIELSLPKKRITNLDMLSGGEKSLVSIAALFALIAVSPPPFLVLDEVDAPLDESNARRFADLVKEFSTKTQFIIVTHNRATMEAADALYGVTMADDGVSKILSLKFEEIRDTTAS